ncbi:bifunctional metallophosphatase/5'-nucleotidase [Lactococcus garvieae]|uniref:2',3'-cyclic-nucleotide 2'-phosphodiesterase/5'-or 3'-nucleotidase, 5'-nucleotidase family n=1 Tax=Lactococcus garvieae TaxID=1363 RepID=A0A1I4GB55_9LACT|nr:bifunctional UDP-sugar hydrolase/5'-nucleotidase [Lactococcus garvieae]SFL27298.1 2',3'-cyclic-nucleotide 2'-phosphodiesterase/5'-or 3'-nucleotidase, 5'-nucleotidase family [Lactococcus garvieae]
MNSLRIIHLNDLHSHLERFPVIERFFAEKSVGHPDVLRFDLGDNVDRVHPLTEATGGQINVALMNELDLTAATLGNNEGLGLTHDMLSRLYKQADFDILLSNITNMPFAHGPKIIKSSWGMRIGILGLTAPYLAYLQAGWDIVDPFVCLDQLLPLDCDFTILLSHLGKAVDEKIAKNYDIDLIIGSHTHHLFEHGAELHGTLLAAAGRYGEHVGEINLTFDQNNKIIASEISTIATNTLKKEKSDALHINSWELEGRKMLQGRTVAEIPQSLTNVYPDYEASYFIAELLARYGKVDACVFNTGLLVTEALPSQLTLDDLHQFLPHSMRLVRLTMRGKELKEVLREMLDVSAMLSGQNIRGMGFRGKRFGQLIFQGISFDRGRFYYRNTAVRDAESYSIVVPDQYLFAWYFPLLKKQEKTEILFPYFLREIVANELKNEKMNKKRKGEESAKRS